MSETETRTELFETVTLSLYCAPGYEPNAEVVAEAWERAQTAIARTFAEHGWPARVEQVR